MFAPDEGCLIGNDSPETQSRIRTTWRLLHNRSTPLLRVVEREIPESHLFHNKYIDPMSRETFVSWITQSLQSWSDSYRDRIEKLIAFEFRGIQLPRFLQRVLIADVRIRLYPVMLSLLEGSGISEIAAVSYIPHASGLIGGEHTEAELMQSLVYRRVAYLSIPSTGPSSFGGGRDVLTPVGVRTALVDYRSYSTTPDYIVMGGYPGVYTVSMNGRSYVSYFHPETPYGKTSVPHYRLTCTSGTCRLKGSPVELPCAVLRPLKYLLYGGDSIVDCLITPPSCLNHIDGGRAINTLILIALGTVKYCGEWSVEALVDYALRNKYNITERYNIPKGAAEVVRGQTTELCDMLCDILDA